MFRTQRNNCLFLKNNIIHRSLNCKRNNFDQVPEYETDHLEKLLHMIASGVFRTDYTKYNGTRILNEDINSIKGTKLIKLYHKVVMKMYLKSCLSLTGDIIESPHLTKLNDLFVKKLCINYNRFCCKDSVLTTCGKLFMIRTFDSDKQYTLQDVAVDLPESVVDISCTSDTTAVLTASGNVYEIKQTSGNEKPEPVLIASGIKAISCTSRNIILQTVEDDIYVNKLSGKTKIYFYKNKKIIKLECSTDHVIVQTEDNQVYSCSCSNINGYPKKLFDLSDNPFRD